MYCRKCGKKVSSEDVFCLNCGGKLESENNQIVKNNQTKLEKVNLVENRTNRNILIRGIILGVLIVLCLGVTYFKLNNQLENNNNTSQSVETLSENNTDDNIQIKSKETSDDNSQIKSKETSDLTKETHKEKEVFAKLLKSQKWLTENTDYEKSPDNIEFRVLDIDKDGIYEMLLYHGDSGGLAGLTLSVVSYNVSEDKVNAQKINVSHGGYIGYVSNKKTIVTSAMFFGVSYIYGYKLEGDRYKQTFSSSDNSGGVESENKIVYTLNDKNVSKEEYDQFIDPIKTNFTDTEMYSISDENIRNVLGIDTSTLTEDKSLDRYSTLKFSTAGQAKEWLLKEDSNFIAKNNLRYIKESNNYDIIKTFTQYFIIEKDDYYLFDAPYMEDDEGEPMRYMVGKHTGNVYLVGPQSQGYAYLIKNNEVIEKLKYGNEESNDWRKLMS